MRSRRPFVVLNPASGRGMGSRRIPTYLELLRRHLGAFEHGVSNRPGGERELARGAVAAGADLVVAVGGDGTWSNVADGVLAEAGADVTVGFLPAGTGNDFVKTFGLPYRDPEEAVLALASGSPRRVDVGRVSSAGRPVAPARDGGWLTSRYFLNVVGFGFDIAVIEAAARSRFLRGELLYKVTALRQLFSFAGMSVELEDGDGAWRGGRHLLVTVSNARYFGGSFPIAPGADLTDGKLDACAILDAGPLVRARLFSQVARGAHESSPMVEIRQSRAFTLRFPEPVRYEVDGEVWEAADREVTAEVVPGALSVVAL